MNSERRLKRRLKGLRRLNEIELKDENAKVNLKQ